MFKIISSWIKRFLADEETVLLATLLIAFFVLIISMGNILAPLLTAIVLAYVMQGIIKWLLGYQIPNALAVSATFMLFLGGFLTTLFWIVPLIWRQMQSFFNELPSMMEKTQKLLYDLPAVYPNIISNNQLDVWIELLRAEVSDIGQWILSFSLSQLPVLMTLGIYIILVPILVFFFLKDKHQLTGWCLSFLPNERPLINQIGEEMNQQVANYIRGKMAEIILMGIATYVFFILFNLNYAALLAFLVGLSVIVPYVGIVIVSLPVVIIAYLQFGWSDMLLYLLIGYTIMQSLDGFVLVPWLFSEAVNLHPVAIITAVLVFGGWWGLWGVFFAIPLATLVKAIMTAWPAEVSN